MSNVNYLLITAAYNEAQLIEKTIQSVTSQRKPPDKWIIVDDGSTDETASIIGEYLHQFRFIELIKREKEVGRDFASKVFAINYGLKEIDLNEYDFVGILDADVSFEPDYYFSLLEEFQRRPKLGIAGGTYFDVYDGKKNRVYPSPFSVRGATQFFRRECFEQIGGLLPLKYGGEDGVACTAARMYGWEVCNIDEVQVLHHRRTGTADMSIIKTRFRDGLVEYFMGYHPLFQFVKCMRRVLKEKPFIIGGFIRLVGFWFAFFKGEKRLIPDNILEYTRKEQVTRIFKMSY